jgi:hypothetical protein
MAYKESFEEGVSDSPKTSPSKNALARRVSKALEGFESSKTANELDDVVEELERSTLKSSDDTSPRSPLLKKMEHAKRRRSSKLESMQDLLSQFNQSQSNVKSALRDIKRRQEEVDESLEFNERRLRLTQVVIQTMEKTRRRHTLTEGEGNTALYEKLRKAKLKIKKKGTIAKLAKLGYDEDGNKAAGAAEEEVSSKK